MRIRLLATLLLITPCLHSQTAHGRLQGCPDPVVIAGALAQLRQNNWDAVTVARVKAMWPNVLFPVACDADVCTVMATNGRIINGNYQCTEALSFNIKTAEDGSRSEQLNGIAIYYSAYERKGVVSAARAMAAASGVPKTDVAAVGDAFSQGFQWTDRLKKQLYGIDIRFSHRGNLWTVFFSLDRYPI